MLAVWVVEVAGLIVGMCLGGIDYYFSNWSQFCVDGFNITPNLQGQGIGSKLSRHVADLLKKDEINRMFLITGLSQAVEFYEKNKFTKSDDGTMMVLDL